MNLEKAKEKIDNMEWQKCDPYDNPGNFVSAVKTIFEAFAEPPDRPDEGEKAILKICPKCAGITIPDQPLKFGDLVKDKSGSLCFVQAVDGSKLSVWTSTSDHTELYNAWRESPEVKFLEHNWHLKTFEEIFDKLTGS